jgi:hypothetical protein
MFGTFVAERDDLPCNYGLVKPLRSNNRSSMRFTNGQRSGAISGGRPLGVAASPS